MGVGQQNSVVLFYLRPGDTVTFGVRGDGGRKRRRRSKP